MLYNILMQKGASEKFGLKAQVRALTEKEELSLPLLQMMA
jgi:hypothetical protein